MAAMTGFCDTVGGVPDWERCTSWLGTPTVEWRLGFWGDFLAPMAIGISAGLMVWWALGLVPSLRGRSTE